MKPLEPCTLILFGAAGNLSRVKLMPGLYRLERGGRLPEGMAILAVGRQQHTREEWKNMARAMLEAKFKDSLDEAIVTRLMQRMHYHENTPGDANAYVRLNQTLSDHSVFPPNIVFFLSVRPADFSDIVSHLAGLICSMKKKVGVMSSLKNHLAPIWSVLRRCKMSSGNI